MKERIEGMIKTLASGNYDNEVAHLDYDSLLEDFILNYDAELVPMMKLLIAQSKDFWYA